MSRPVGLAAGIILMTLGALAFFRGAHVTSRKDILRVGHVKVSTEESNAIPPWAAGIAVAAGVMLVAASARQRS